MTNTKITRTVNTATATLTYVDLKAMNVVKSDESIITTQKVTEKDFQKMYNDGERYKLLKVESIRYESALYEMSLETFVKNAEKSRRWPCNIIKPKQELSALVLTRW